MRTTIAIDDDVLAAAKVSELARSSLRPPAASAERNGIPLLPVRRPNATVTLDIVNALRDELP